MGERRRIRVLHVSDKLTVGDAHMHGVTRLFSWWIPEYDASRFEVMAASLRGRDRAGEHLESLGIRVFYFGRGKFDPRTLTDMLGLVRRERIDILHLHGYGATDFGRVCSLICKVPCIVHEHMYDAGIPSYQRFADRMLSGATTRAIAVSDSVKEFLVRLRAVPPERIETVYNGVPMHSFDRGGSAAANPQGGWRAAEGIPPEHAVVATVGRLHPIKGQRYFLEAARLVLQEFDAVTFAVVGDGDLMDDLRNQAAEAGISERIRFLGHREDVPAVLREVQIKVISSLSEGVPMTLFEAMASGCAVVSTDVGGLGEVLCDGETAFLVPAQDPQALARRVLELLRDPSLRRRMADRAAQEVGRYDLSRTVRRFERTYEELVSS